MANYFLRLTALSVTLSLGLASMQSLPARATSEHSPLSQTVLKGGERILAEVNYQEPNTEPPPGNREAGASRSPCLSGDRSLIALTPEKSGGLTGSEHPTFFFYVPPNTAQSAELILKDENKNKVYETSVSIASTTPGIVKIGMPAGASKPLEIGKNYRWYFSLICNPDDRSGDLVVDGWVRRVELSQTLVGALEKAKERQRAALYAEARLWYDTLTALAVLRMDNPSDSQLAADWKDLLNKVGLAQLAETPLVQ